MRIWRRGILTAICGAALLAGARPCAAQLGAELISNPAARQLGLERIWATQLRVDPLRGRVAHVVVHRNLIVAQTSLGTVQAVDAETGRTYWVAEIGKPLHTVQAPAVDDRYVAVTSGIYLYLLDRASGGEKWRQRLGHAPSAGPALSEERVYVPLDGGFVESYKLERDGVVDSVPDRFSGTGGAAQPPITAGNRVLWTSSNGYVYSREQTKELIQFRFRMNDEGVAAPVYMSPYVYAASRAGTIYCLDEVTGLDIWQLAVGNSVSQPLAAIDGKLFVITETGEMLRVDPLSGKQVWYATGVRRFVAASAKNIYVIDAAGRLALLDADSGARIGAMPSTGLDLEVRNTSNDRIYLGTTTGMLQCLREIAQAKPLEHTPGFAIAPKPKEGATPAAAPTDVAPAAESAAPAAAANPFGS